MSTTLLGDYQTPLPLVRDVLRAIRMAGARWARALEPTCGQGNFIRGLLELDDPPREIIGLDIQDGHVRAASGIEPPPGVRVHVAQADVFATNLRTALCWETRGPLLVVGNPPWLTSAASGALGGANLPRKSNLKGLAGLEAITGKANFDVAEFIFIKLVQELMHEQPTVALLCKTSVARSVLRYARTAGWPVLGASLHRVPAQRWFGASADACLFTLRVGPGTTDYTAAVYDSLSDPLPCSALGFAGQHLVPDAAAYEQVAFLDGASPVQWRQGVKHDAASVLELAWHDGAWRNTAGEAVDVEPDCLFPLVKSGDLNAAPGSRPTRAVLLPQTRLGEDTLRLTKLPRTWAYLQKHADVFARRRSSIYARQAPFSVFGVGDYTFTRYKVAVSGLHKRGRFAPIGPREGRPVVCDDACYVLPLRSPAEAALFAAALNHPLTSAFLDSTVFWDAKRPITKSVLSRVDVAQLVQHVPWADIVQGAEAALAELSPEDRGNWTSKLAAARARLEPATHRQLALF